MLLHGCGDETLEMEYLGSGILGRVGNTSSVATPREVTPETHHLSTTTAHGRRGDMPTEGIKGMAAKGIVVVRETQRVSKSGYSEILGSGSRS